MMSPFVLHQPDSVESACALLDKYGGEAKILAGGSELVALLKLGLVNAGHVVDIKGIRSLGSLDYDPEREAMQIGALVTHRAIERSEVARKHFHPLVEMERQVANVRVRNVGTLAGNLCFADPRADPGTLLAAYQARVRVRSRRGEKIFDISEFFVDYHQTALAEDEVLTEIEVPKLKPNYSATYLRFCPGERPAAAVALVIGWGNGKAKDVRLVLGCVGPKPLRALGIEEELCGKSANEILADAMEIGEQAAVLCDPLDDIWGSADYKRQIVKTLIARGLAELCGDGNGHG